MVTFFTAHTAAAKFRLPDPDCGRPWLILGLGPDHNSTIHIGVMSSRADMLATSERLLENLTQVVAELKTRMEKES